MTKEARLKAARERVKRWKKNHPKSIRDQWARRYERKKEEATRERKGVLVKLRIIEPVERGRQETYLEHPAYTDGDVEVVGAHWEATEKRTGKQAPPRGGRLMEPEQKGGQARREEGWPVEPKGGRTAETIRVDQELEKFKVKRARLERPGVAVKLEVPE